MDRNRDRERVYDYAACASERDRQGMNPLGPMPGWIGGETPLYLFLIPVPRAQAAEWGRQRIFNRLLVLL